MDGKFMKSSNDSSNDDQKDLMQVTWKYASTLHTVNSILQSLVDVVT